ncbi:unnamed protein product [Paramecium primaurelia]|uniref:ATP-dependent RNA helicase n=1 Tax=Paramecium primaurelia TaxID=5886 RepID=A0A8S1MYP0_PARPR|nr:unnamed protein product [Paramecium primaurelia]
MITQNQWSQFNLKPIIQKIMANEFKFQYLIPVYIASISHIINNNDVSVQTQTGSGNKLIFLVPLFNQFSKQKQLDNQLFGLNNKIYDVEKKFQIVNQVKIVYTIVGTYNKNDINYLNEKGYNILIAKINKLRQLLDMSDQQIDVKTLEYLIFNQVDRQ